MSGHKSNPALPTFRTYEPGDFETCLALFDANCPEFFAANERPDYEAFLRGGPPGYSVCMLNNRAVGAFGVTIGDEQARSRLNWIMIDPAAHGQRIGSRMMQLAMHVAAEAGVEWMDIATSQLSIDFFGRFGAVELQRTVDGWGPGMDKVDMELAIRPA